MTPVVDRLRRLHPRFIYQRYAVKLAKKTLTFDFQFEIEPGIRFFPKVVFKNIDQQRVAGLGDQVLNNLAFQLGLIEIPSYWKASCSPQIVIRSGLLTKAQLGWWQDLFSNGLAEFFYTNQIKINEQFFSFKLEPLAPPPCQPYPHQLDDQKVLVPISGGKDSVVAFGLLKKTKKKLSGWFLNPSPAALRIAKIGKPQALIKVKRFLDPTLFHLNKKGYLNGHTPFSAYLAFLSTVSAVIGDLKMIAFANERSANEIDLIYDDQEINHQYSKSYQFETKFRTYAKRWLAKELNYFSLLRPLYGLQIAKIFAGYPKYFPVVRSCNRGLKSNSWCCRCEKCLFVFTVLFPFVDQAVLTKTIFPKNLFAEPELIGIALNLLGRGKTRPLECVGTTEEAMAAFYLCLVKVKKESRLPPVLEAVEAKVLCQESGLAERSQAVLGAWNKQHHLPAEFKDLLRQEVGQ